MASRPQYIAIPPSFDNTRKNLLARIEIPKKSKIIAPYPPSPSIVELSDDKVSLLGNYVIWMKIDEGWV